MKSILMEDLKPGDIFCHEFKLSGRKAFLVEEVKADSIICFDREDVNKTKEIKKTRKGTAVFLRHI